VSLHRVCRVRNDKINALRVMWVKVKVDSYMCGYFYFLN
jgi:hypothetical protein